ncbi:MAG: L,D-transpeptidase [Cyanobacteria bacterium P01_H01_bin.150]
MLIRITLISVICLTLISCLHGEQKKKANNSPTVSTTPTTPVIPKENIKPKLNSEDQKIATANTNPLNYSGNFMTLIPTGQTNTQNNPLYRLSLYADGKLVHSFVSVSGRASTQARNRHQSGTEAPLPDGKYAVSTSAIPGSIAEAGDYFLAIQPKFQTGRSALGFHVDPSFEKSNGEDGTAGCIGLTNREDLDKLLSFVATHKPEFLDVTILDKTDNNLASKGEG